MNATRIPMTKTGYCQWPSMNLGHGACTSETCDCSCHEREE